MSGAVTSLPPLGFAPGLITSAAFALLGTALRLATAVGSLEERLWFYQVIDDVAAAE
jgi:hypothetical protein